MIYPFNLFCLDDFYLLAADDAIMKENLVKKFGEVLIYFWKM